jgi:RNA polymerase sigma factor (TIGR02999 family)
MPDVTQILAAVEAGDPQAAAELLPLVYDELRTLAAARMAEEKPGQTLTATALVHEAYLRLVGGEQPQDWNRRGHFFSAAAEAMRRILVDAARRRKSVKHGGGRHRQEFDAEALPAPVPGFDLLALDAAVGRLASLGPLPAGHLPLPGRLLAPHDPAARCRRPVGIPAVASGPAARSNGSA